MTSEYTTEHKKFIIQTVYVIQHSKQSLSANLVRLVKERFPTLNKSFEALYKVYKLPKNSKVRSLSISF